MLHDASHSDDDYGWDDESEDDLVDNLVQLICEKWM